MVATNDFLAIKIRKLVTRRTTSKDLRDRPTRRVATRLHSGKENCKKGASQVKKKNKKSRMTIEEPGIIQSKIHNKKEKVRRQK